MTKLKQQKFANFTDGIKEDKITLQTAAKQRKIYSPLLSKKRYPICTTSFEKLLQILTTH